MRLVVLLFVLAAAEAGASAASSFCCPWGGAVSRSRQCADGSRFNLDNCSQAYFMDGALEPLKIDEGGHLFLISSGIRVDEPPGKFCVSEMWPNGSVAGAIVCFPEWLEEQEAKSDAVYTAYGAMLLVSAAFLVLTLAVYLWLPALRDRDGLCLSAYVGSLALGSGSLALVQLLTSVITNAACVFMAFFVYYWLLAAFFWLNIVAFNVWQCVAQKQVHARGRTLVWTLVLYGWGCPLVFLVATLATHHAPGHYNLLAPGFGDRRCWFTTQLQSWAYFFGPVSVLLAINLVLFVWAAVLLWKTQPTNTTSRPHKTLRFRCQLYTKLLLIMGLTWLLEVISFASGDQGYAWLVTDALNCLQGVLIFLLLVVFRRRVRRLLLAHFAITSRCLNVQPSPLSQAEMPSEDEEDYDEVAASSDDVQELKSANVRANGHHH